MAGATVAVAIAELRVDGRDVAQGDSYMPDRFPRVGRLEAIAAIDRNYESLPHADSSLLARRLLSKMRLRQDAHERNTDRGHVETYTLALRTTTALSPHALCVQTFLAACVLCKLPSTD